MGCALELPVSERRTNIAEQKVGKRRKEGIQNKSIRDRELITIMLYLPKKREKKKNKFKRYSTKHRTPPTPKAKLMHKRTRTRNFYRVPRCPADTVVA